MSRRSMMSGTSSPHMSPHVNSSVEDLSPVPHVAYPTQPEPIAGSSTVAYGPDQMLAVYAARAKSASPASQPTPSIPTQGLPMPKPALSKMRMLTGLVGKKGGVAISGPILPEDIGRAE